MLDFIDSHYFLIFLIMILLPIIAQSNVKSTVTKFSKVANLHGLTGSEVAQEILRREGIENVEVLPTKGFLTDNYNPAKKTVNLSEAVYNQTSITAAAIAAHEVGHAIQHHKGYFGLTLRSFVYPFAQVGTRIAGIAILIGLLAAATGFLYIGIFALILILVFQLATLPVEFNASARAIEKLKDYEIIEDSEVGSARSVLTAAALTYLTVVIVTLLNILRLIAIARRN